MMAKGMKLKRREGEPFVCTMGEAFALMKYRNPASGRIEWLWNSRDGVTPFGIDDPLCPELAKNRYRERMRARDFKVEEEPDPASMSHVDWHEDVFLPNFVPTEGTRIFMSWAEAPEDHRARVRVAFEAYVARMRATAGLDDDQAEKMLAGEPYGFEPHAPTIVIVTPELVEHFHTLASTNPYVPPPAPGPRLITPQDRGFDDFTKPLKGI